MSEKRCCFTAAFVLLATVGLCFSGTLRTGFVSDDFVLVHKVATGGYYSSWGGAGDTFYRPVTTLSYLTDFHIWGNDPAGFHLTNVFWHLLSGIAVFLFIYFAMKQVPFSKPCLYAILSSVLFLVLASHSESVAWVSGRTDIIATVMCLMSLCFFYRQLSIPSVFYSTLALLLFLVGLLAKESVIITPLLWVLLFFYNSPSQKGNPRRNLVLIGFSVLVAAGYLVLRIIFSNSLVSGLKYGRILDLSPISLAENLVRYTFRVFIPYLPLSFRGFVTENPIIVPLFLLVLILPILFLVFKRATAKQKNFLFLMVGCFFVSLLPVLGMKVSLFDTQSERFLYLPSVFATGFFTVALISLFRESKLSLIVLVIMILFQGIFLQRSNGNWREAGRLCSGIAQSVAEYDADSIYILAIPDSFRGAYVFRNGLDESVAMLTGRKSKYTVYCKISSYGDSLVSENASRIDLDETERTVITCADGIMQPIR